MKRTIHSQCPYCLFVNRLDVDFDNMLHKRIIVTCDSDEGGCERDYILDIDIEMVQKTHTIEGEDIKS